MVNTNVQLEDIDVTVYASVMLLSREMTGRRNQATVGGSESYETTYSLEEVTLLSVCYQLVEGKRVTANDLPEGERCVIIGMVT